MKTRTRIHRADIESLPAYSVPPAHDLGRVIKLDANENPYGPSPRALAALADTRTWQFYHRQEDLRAALANYAGVQFENVVVSNGADESIDLVFRTTLEPGNVVIDCPPTFEMYRILAQVNHARVVEVHRREDFSLDLDRVVEMCQRAQAKALVVCSPNNPDGARLPRADLLRLLALPTLIVVDEAYAEFSGDTAVDLLAEHDNLVIMRTFSKWAGLAGLRIGYALLPSALTEAVLMVKAPYNVNAAGLVAALASLEDRDYLMDRVRVLIAERERMFRELSAFGCLRPRPSHTNFMLCRVEGLTASALRDALASRDILIRAYTSPRLSDYIRFSIGTPEQNDAVLAALRVIIGKE